ncbi:Ig-like domain-containing protein [Aquimarina aquimarini]|uniref:Ig-like domain-containing protein n=1 Tax=Aquimarina aquimarini TaxID=1191734 RepID=UPI000D562948|nr:Ig-like domain-containing protein [Aquimarina aquimarini]
MSKRIHTILLVAASIIIIVGCAKKGSITGGPKDETPPVVVKAFPPNFSTSFNKKEIRIYFDEYVKLKDAQKQIIVSPPMDPKPTITPMGSANKFIKIKFIDTLLENTTYSINFGESIVDNNEENPNPFFRYVFSTGDFLDSLSIKGTVSDAVQKEADEYVTVALYEIDEEYSDSVVYKNVPRYITNTLDTIAFDLHNLKEGKFKLIALKDVSNNYTYDPKQDKIGFYEEIITLPKDTAKVFNLTLFKEILDFKVLHPKQVSKNEFIFPYEGVKDSMQVKLLSKVPDDFETRVFPDKKKDTLHYWFRPFFEADSLLFEVTNIKNYKDTITTRFKDQYKDSLVLASDVGNTLALNKNFVFSANTALDSINEKLISLTDKDTLEVPFSVDLDIHTNEVELIFDKTESNAYNLKFLPEAVKDFVGNVNDTININFRTKRLADYGTIFLTLENVEAYPVLVQITDEKENVIAEQVAREQRVLTFDHLDPSKYFIRVIVDSNDNGIWDSGNFLKGIQPEEIRYFDAPVDVRANWEIKQTFVLDQD